MSDDGTLREAARWLAYLCEDGAWAYGVTYDAAGHVQGVICRLCRRPQGSGHAGDCRYGNALRAIETPTT